MRPLFSDAELAAMRNETVATMVSTVRIVREGAYVDTGGGAGYYQPPTETTTQGRFSAVTATEDTIAEQTENVATGRLALPLGTDIRAEDEVFVDGVRFDVVGLPPIQTYAVERYALLRRPGA